MAEHYSARPSAPLFAHKLDHASAAARLTESEWVAAPLARVMARLAERREIGKL